MKANLSNRIKKVEKLVQHSDFKPVVFVKPGEIPRIIDPRTVVIIDDIPEID